MQPSINQVARHALLNTCCVVYASFVRAATISQSGVLQHGRLQGLLHAARLMNDDETNLKHCVAVASGHAYWFLLMLA
jgi:hypothetical protein